MSKTLVCKFQEKVWRWIINKISHDRSCQDKLLSRMDAKNEWIEATRSQGLNMANESTSKCWCKHAFSFYPKCDVLMNNIVESFNATILVVRDKPILTMCEWIRKYLMNMCYTSAIKLDKWPHKVMPIPRKRLDNEVAMSGHWMPTWAMDGNIQITHSYNTHEFIVDIAKRSCTYNF